jgi:hypothetical protein
VFGQAEYERRSAPARPTVDESAEALRRRADVLLDEMMLTGVDIGFDGSFAVDAAPSAGHDPVHANGFTENGHQHYSPAPAHTAEPPVYSDYSLSGALPETPALSPTASVGGVDANPAPAPTQWPAATASLFTPLPSQEEPPPQSARLIPAEARYAPSAPAAPLLPGANGFPSTGSTAVRRQSASLASTMTVGGRANSRSTLLPRAIEVDVDTAAQEILALSSEISAALPVGHEAAERSRHLLNKAQNILQSDPSRTAEVDYYLQQVRRIVQRTQQTHTDSALYRRRLTLYLAAWAALSVTVLAARYVLEAELLALLEDFFWTSPDAVWVRFGPLALGAIFAGALGAALGVLLNMRRHAAQEYGYFDRKYGLRGLLLPLLGASFGLLLALLWATVCYFTGLDAANLWVGGLPAVLAFVLGFGQEWLYGAR